MKLRDFAERWRIGFVSPTLHALDEEAVGLRGG
jgi:hypothetical protein